MADVFMIEINQKLHGRILDIGGGGECIIGRAFGKQVIAIDNRQEELDEAPDCCEKVLMDARFLAYPNGSFDHVTFFYSLMFMDTQVQKQALAEAVRVLKKDGKLHIWDADIPCTFPEPFIADLDVRLHNKIVHTRYGVVNNIKNQTIDSISTLCIDNGMTLQEKNDGIGCFYLAFSKPA